MSLTLTASDRIHRPGDIDWAELRASIVSRLDVVAEYRSLGVKFTRSDPSPKGWIACYAVGRKDEHPSAAVNIHTGIYHDSGGDGTTISLFEFSLRHGGDRFGSFIDVLRHYARKAGIAMPNARAGKGGRIREALYEYRDEIGHLRYAVFRYRMPNGSKSFSQHPPDGNGGWIYGQGCMDGVVPLPYRLPELIASADRGDTVFIVEGESCVERLVREGLTATTNHQGAQATDSTWPRFSDYFRGRDCCILPDNDVGGRKHALRVAELLKPKARSVKILELHGLPIKGDVVNWFDQGHDVEELGRLAHETPIWDPEVDLSAQEAVRFATVADIRRVLSQTRWIWPGWIPSSRTVGIGGFEGTGKTRFGLDLCRRAFLQMPWPDGSPPTFPNGTRSIWICSDAHQDELAEILPAFGLPDDAVFFPTTPEDPYGGTDLDDPETIDILEEAIREVRPGLIFVDTLTSATARDLCDQRTIKPLKQIFSRLTQTHQVPIILLLHLSREGQALGRRIKGLTRTLMHLECPVPEQPSRLRLWMEKTFSKRPPQLGVTMTDSGNDYDADPPKPAESKAAGRPPVALDLARDFILKSLRQRGFCGVLDLCNEFVAGGGSERTFWRARDALVGAGEVTCDGSPKVVRLVKFQVVNQDFF